MKSIESIVTDYKSQTIDGRDLHRLAEYLTADQVELMGMSFTTAELRDAHECKPFTEENIIEQLRVDVDFAFEKALNKRGLSAGLMYNVVSMWNWILENAIEDSPEGNYAQYGLPLFKATALLYGFDNPIGDDVGDEHKYSDEGVVGRSL